MANTVLLEARPYRPFKSSEEYLYAMREDLAEWLNTLYPDLRITVDNFMDRLDTGVVLCKHANNVRQAAEEYIIRRQARNKSMTKSMTSGLAGPILAMGNVYFLPAAKSGTFFARDNVSNFITWCRKSLQIFECLLFETDDLIMRKNEKHVILCLLEVARRGAKFGMLAPMLVQMERQIYREIAADIKINSIDMSAQTDEMIQSIHALNGDENLFDSDSDDEDEIVQPMLVYGPQPQVITNDLRSLDEMVRELVKKCTCPSQFPMVRISDGKYRIGDTKVLIFVRILRSHVMVRVGGGWDTLSHYLDKHDPCRCRSQHRSTVGARLVTRTNQANNGIELHKAQVYYERSSQQKPKSVNFISDLRKSPNADLKDHSPTQSQAATPTQRADEQITTSPRRSLSPYPSSLQQRTDTKAKNRNSNNGSTNITALINEIESIKWLDDDTSIATGQNSTSSNEVDSKYENASDNGSEISDEGYRSLGLTQQANATSSSKQTMANGKTLNGLDDDVRIETTSNDDSQSVTINSSPADTPSAGTPIMDQQLRHDDVTSQFLKTNENPMMNDDAIKTKSPSRIPRSPMTRRRSIDSCSSTGHSNASPATGLPVFSRKLPVYRSVRKSAPNEITAAANSRSPITQKLIQQKQLSTDERDSAKMPATKTVNNNNNNQKTKSVIPHSASSSRIGKTSKLASPKKVATSPLAQQILEVAENAQNDAQMLEKMKQLLSKYKTTPIPNLNSNGKYSPKRKPSNASILDDDDRNDFCSLDLNTNDQRIAENSLRKTRSNSTISSRDNIAFGKGDSLIADRPVRGTTRIPAPIRQNTELY